MLIGLSVSVANLQSRNALSFLTKADGSPITKSDNNLILKGL